MSTNRRSLLDKKAEFHTVLDYVKPGVIKETKAWLKGVKPGIAPSKNAIKTLKSFWITIVVYKHSQFDNNMITVFNCIMVL